MTTTPPNPGRDDADTNDADEVDEIVPVAVWPCAQATAQRQRAGSYLPECREHPGKMLPDLARRIVRAYSRPDDLVVDPMCGTGTALVEAARLGRRAIGVDLEARWVDLTARNLDHALDAAARPLAEARVGDARQLPNLLGDVAGEVDLVTTSPPYGCDTGVIDKPAWISGARLCDRTTLNYSGNAANLGHARGEAYRAAMAAVYTACHAVVRPGGLLVTVTKNMRRHGRLSTSPPSRAGWQPTQGSRICSTWSRCTWGSVTAGWSRGRHSGSCLRSAAPVPPAIPCTWWRTRTSSSSPEAWRVVGEPIPLSVWPTAQQTSKAQRAGRYLPASMAHPAKMLPALARRAITAYTDSGDVVIDPMCGIGTTLVEAVHLGRDAVGIEYEPPWADLARTNLAYAKAHGAKGTGRVHTGDGRDLPQLLPAELHGRVGLVLTSPPYGASVHGHVTATPNLGVAKRNDRYTSSTRGSGNLAHAGDDGLLDAFTGILAAARTVLRPDGIVVVTARPWRRNGVLVDFPAAVTTAAEHAELTMLERNVALLAGL
jgi:tRNA G10  N-methylase Trm11